MHSHWEYRAPAWYRLISGYSRRTKYRSFVRATSCGPGDTIVDVGSGAGTFLEGMHPHAGNVIALDIEYDKVKRLTQRFPSVLGLVASAAAMPFRDGAFDIAFSNAVLEHIPPELRPDAAAEIIRVSRRFCVIVPNGAFPLEPHSKTLFIHWLADATFRKVLRLMKRLRLIAMSPAFYYTCMRMGEVRQLFPRARPRLIMLGAHILAAGESRARLARIKDDRDDGLIEAESGAG